MNPGVIRTTRKMQADDKLPWSKYSTEMHCKIRCQCICGCLIDVNGKDGISDFKKA